MKTKRLLVVGDQFEDFAKYDSVVTLSQLRSGVDGADRAQILIGQGLSHDEVSALEGVDTPSKCPLVFECRDELAPLQLTHKHDMRHVIVTHPRALGNSVYVSQLAVNEIMDRLLDHITGGHVSGMMLIEAARQAGIAAAEMEYDLASKADSTTFVWTGLQVDFSRFAFPVPTSLKISFAEEEDSHPGKPKYVSKMVFEQDSVVITEMYMHFRLMPTRAMASIEARSARRIVQSLCRSRAQSQADNRVVDNRAEEQAESPTAVSLARAVGQ